MGNVGFSEMLLLAVIALLVVGPRRLPEMARGLGRFHRMATGAWQNLRREFQAEIDNEHNQQIMKAARQARLDMEKLAQQAQQGADRLVSDTKGEEMTGISDRDALVQDPPLEEKPGDQDASDQVSKKKP